MSKESDALTDLLTSLLTVYQCRVEALEGRVAKLESLLEGKPPVRRPVRPARYFCHRCHASHDSGARCPQS